MFAFCRPLTRVELFGGGLKLKKVDSVISPWLLYLRNGFVTSSLDPVKGESCFCVGGSPQQAAPALVCICTCARAGMCPVFDCVWIRVCVCDLFRVCFCMYVHLRVVHVDVYLYVLACMRACACVFCTHVCVRVCVRAHDALFCSGLASHVRSFT